LLARLPSTQRDTVLRLSAGGGPTYTSIVVAGASQTWVNSAACLRIGRELRGPLRVLAWLAGLVPSPIRDALYRLMSRYRKRFFGESPECRLWDDNWDTRFVDDALFGGRSEAEADPFADPNAAQEEATEDLEEVEEPLGTPPKVGDRMRVVSARPILHTHVTGYEDNEGLCSVGLVGIVKRVLERNAYPKNIVVQFDFLRADESTGAEVMTSFDAHFSEGQLRLEKN